MAKNITVEDTLEADWARLCRSGSFQADPLQPGQQCGQVHTQRGRIAIDCHQDENSIRISVTDTGIGHPARGSGHHLRRIPAGRGNGGTNHQGTGLGLAITKRW